MKKFILTSGLVLLFTSSAFGAAGKIIDGRTMVPVRGVFEELGFNVLWDAETQAARINDNYYEIKLYRGEKTFTVNDKAVVPEVPQQIIDGSFYLPLKAVGDSIGAAVSWDNNTKTAHISYRGKDAYVNCNPQAGVQAADNSMTYPEFPNVPDFGKVNNLTCQASFNDEDNMLYVYNGNLVAPEMLDNFEQALLKEGFVQIPVGQEENMVQIAWTNKTDTTVVIGMNTVKHEFMVTLLRINAND